MAAVATETKSGITEVEVLQRWRGSPVNALERCGIPDALAKELAGMNPPAVRIIREHVPPTEGIGKNGQIGGDAPVNQIDVMCTLVRELVAELKSERERRR